jgi:predicted membrane protein
MKHSSLYYLLAKCGLQASSLVLAVMLTTCMVLCFSEADTKYIPFIISSAQGLSCIALGVMSYHLGLNK